MKPDETAEGTHPGKGGGLRPVTSNQRAVALVVAWSPDRTLLGNRLFPGHGGLDIGRTEPPFDVDRQTSRRHARLERASGGGLSLRDLGSRNGTWVNGRQVPADAAATLGAGDVVTIGDTMLLAREVPLVRGPDAEVSDILGASEEMRQLRSTIRRFARAPAPVLVLGETGVGKELVARALAELGRGVTSRPYLAFNSTATSAHLIDTTLFGNLRGAYTGADKARKGLFESAHTGTLFLDEIGELGPEVQVKLLRVLQEGEVTPVGSVKPLKVDVRLVSATNRDLVRAVRDGGFRSDLYSRLAKLSIRVPPLRDHLEDVPLLATALSKRMTGEEATFSTASLTRLLMHRWPLNVRELDGVVTQAVVEWGDQPGKIDLSPETIQRMQEHARLGGDPTAGGRSLDAETVEDALRRTAGNMKQAAELLGKDRGQLYRIVKRLGLQPTDYRE